MKGKNIGTFLKKTLQKKKFGIFCNSNNIRTFASRLLSNCTKSLVLRTLLHQVSDCSKGIRLVLLLIY